MYASYLRTLISRSSRLSIVTISKRQIENLVSTDWLSTNFVTNKSVNVKLVHAVARSTDFTSHIPGAACFDVSMCRDKNSSLPNMLPSAEFFEEYVNNFLYINNDDHVIIYDGNPDFPSLVPGSRVWFMFKVFGHDNVSLLNGGFFKWLNEGRSISKQFSTSTKNEKKFKASFQSNLVAKYDEVSKNVETENCQLIDARVPSLFNAQLEDPTGKPGHIPKSINLPFTKMINCETKLILDDVELKSVFESANVDLSKPIISSCATGVTACAILFGQNICGKKDGKLYDGSWTEWNQRSNVK